MKPTITIVSLGPGSPALMTLQAAETLRGAKCLILRTERHPAADWLKEQGIPYSTLDDMYDLYEDFDEMHGAMAARLWSEAARHHVVYAVTDAATDGSAEALTHAVPEDGQLIRLPGVSLTDAYLSLLPAHVARSAGIRSIPATDWESSVHDPRLSLMITELNSRALAGNVKLWLTELYDDEKQVIFFPSSVKGAFKAVAIPLLELDRQKVYDHTAAIYIPPSPLRERHRFCFADLVEILGILCGENGCPWDREQTHESLQKYLIEEAYEAAYAIDEGNPEHLSDELGDVLLQVVFHAQVGKAHGTFSIGDITTAICQKMMYRHAHIFGHDHCETADDVSANWERLKKAEKGLTTQASVLADVSRGLPALMRASKVQKKAAQVGFDWDTPLEALPKVHEEAEEVRAELEKHADPAEELGDLLFSCVNVARLCGLDAEFLLKSATEKFISRFTAMENLINSDGKSLEGLTLREMDVYWNQVKSAQNRCDKA